jgi:hypothetical protein
MLYQKIRQMASNASTLTFQLYHGILLGVNLDIQNLLLSFYCPPRGLGEKPSPLGEDFSMRAV